MDQIKSFLAHLIVTRSMSIVVVNKTYVMVSKGVDSFVGLVHALGLFMQERQNQGHYNGSI